MKKQLFIAGLLIVLDQLVKILVFHFAMEERVIFIPGTLRFEPLQNTNLSWFASIANFDMPIIIMVVLQIAITIGVIILYRYQRYISTKTNLWLCLGFCMVFAGAGCSFFDVVFWGGSLDYIGLVNWFTFDLKDLFLNIGWISFVLWFNSKDYKSRETKNLSFKSWISRGCKLLKD